MGWDVQGYYKNPGEQAPSWHVNCSGDSLEEVDAYGERNPLSKAEENSLQLYYGSRNLELFRGFSPLTEQEKIKVLLAKFEDYPVYAEKWNPLKKVFLSQKIEFLSFSSLTIFHEKIEGNPALVKRGLTDLLDRLTSSDQSDHLDLKAFQSHIQSISIDEKG